MRHPLLISGVLAAAALGVRAPTTSAQLPRVITVRATDYKFEAPASAPAGTITFRLVNDGKEVHHLWLVQLLNGKTYGDFITAMESWDVGRMPAWAVDVGGPNEASPNVNADATITLKPGTYAMVCYVPSPDGKPHVMKGMVKEFTVTKEGAAKANEPKADVTLTLNDYAYLLSKPIQPGMRVIRIENTAKQSHEVVIGKLLPGRTMAEALTWLNEGQNGPAPVIAIGGASGLSKGKHQFIALTLDPGRYVFLCFIPDIKDGKPHTAHGMVKEFTVAAPKTK